MTTKDIAKAQIYFIGKGGEILIGETADPITLQFDLYLIKQKQK